MVAPAPLAATVPVVRLAGRDDERCVESLLAATLRQGTLGPDRLELELVDFGAGRGGAPGFLFDDVALGAALELAMGGSSKVTLFRGEITALEERQGGGAPRLVVLAEDALHRLARDRRSRVFAEKSLDDVVQEIAGEAGLQADAQAGSATATWHQLNESTLAFLRRLLAPLDLPLRLDAEGRLVARPFADPAEAIELHAGDQIQSLRLIADLARLVTEGKSHGRDLSAGDSVEEACATLQPAPAGRSGPDLLGELGWPGPAFAPTPEPASRAQGEAFAKGRFARAAARFLHGELIVDGEPRLVPGAAVELSGVSPRFRGRWQVGAAVHRFDRAHGYQTLAEVARAGLAP